jgi:uncharacterized protein (TIGR03067 family)
MIRFLPLAVLAVAFSAANKPAPEKKTDADLIQGTWAVATVELEGNQLKDGFFYASVKDWKLTFKDGSLSNANVPDFKATYTLAADKKPQTLNIVVQGEEKKKGVMLYELKGDTLRLCVNTTKEDEQPNEFDSKNGRVVFTFKREKAAEK